MKLIYQPIDSPETVKILTMERTESAFFQGAGMHAGWQVAEKDDFLPGDGEGEWLSTHILMSMYEGAEAAGSYRDWSWAIVPETTEENEHLAALMGRVLYRTDC